MATIAVAAADTTRAPRSGAMSPVNLCTALGGNVDSTNVADRGGLSGGGALVVTNVDGGSGTVKLDIQGSVDGINWFNVPYALQATPRTFVVSQITLTTAGTRAYLLQELVFWRYLKAVMSSNTAETLTADYYQSAS
jgi:hypothetical protein